MAAFAYNSAESETTGISPFEASYGMLPRQSGNDLIRLHILMLQARYSRMYGKGFGNV